MNTLEHLVWAGVVVLLSIVIVCGFGNCDQSGALKKYKMCLEVTKDPKACEVK